MAKAGRPTVMTEEALAKLTEAFSAGATDKEACAHAGIAVSTMMGYQANTPGFLEQKEALKEKPMIAARLLIARKAATDISTAQWYAERKKKDEFSTRTENTGKDGEALTVTIVAGNGNKPE